MLYALLAALAGAVSALSLAQVLLSTGWPALLHLAYAMVSAGFAVICALAALDLSSPDEIGRFVDARIRRKRREFIASETRSGHGKRSRI
jgi:hypothetical protein